MPGSGKSTLAKSLGPRINYNLYDLDELIEQSENKAIREIFNESGEDSFRQIEADTLRAVVGDKDKFILSCGGGTPCYHSNMEFLNQAGCSIFLDTDLEELFNRLNKTDFKIRPLINQHEEDLEQYLKRLLDLRKPFYEKAQIVWDGSDSEEKLMERLNSE